MGKIKTIKAREILDSRGNPTIEVEVVLASGLKVWASVPSGASTGAHEVLELRDGDKDRYGGKGVLQAVKNVNQKIAPKLIGMSPNDQTKIDKLMIDLDGTENKSKLGANAILGVSLAVARVAALDSNKPLYAYLRKKYFSAQKRWSFPVPMMNILNGGVHAGWSIDVQEFMITPQQKNIKEAVRCGSEIFQILKKILATMKYPVTVGDEGGFAPKLSGNERALELMTQAVQKSGYILKQDVKFAIDIAASEFYQTGKYNMKADNKIRTSNEMTAMCALWIKKYPIELIEDGLSEDDWSGWNKMTSRLGKKITLVGDDLFVTNIKRLKRGINEGIANAILIKLNQIGTLTETIDCIKLAQKHKYKLAISHRSGETSDDFIADLAVASGAEYIKTGSM
ncbi:MAG TPA: phosphopyruvate hydratase, partial [Patescibacteria group bacterium]|nr:phosphopyruvate hydratase [Patescibacteria group bacterium]